MRKKRDKKSWEETKVAHEYGKVCLVNEKKVWSMKIFFNVFWAGL